MTARLRPLILGAVVTGALLSGCSSVTSGVPVASPTDLATMTTAPTSTVSVAVEPGYRPNAAGSSITVEERSVGPVNDVAALAISDAQAYWTLHDDHYLPRHVFIALPGPDPSNECLKKLDIARACTEGIAWETPEMQHVYDASGVLGVVTILAHEVGHHVELSRFPDESDLNENVADCMAGVYFQSVIEGTSPRFIGTRDEVDSAAQRAFEAIRGPGNRPTSTRMEVFHAGLDGGTSDTCISEYA